MNNRKTKVLGLIAILAITPILVADPDPAVMPIAAPTAGYTTPVNRPGVAQANPQATQLSSNKTALTTTGNGVEIVGAFPAQANAPAPTALTEAESIKQLTSKHSKWRTPAEVPATPSYGAGQRVEAGRIATVEIMPANNAEAFRAMPSGGAAPFIPASRENPIAQIIHMAQEKQPEKQPDPPQPKDPPPVTQPPQTASTAGAANIFGRVPEGLLSASMQANQGSAPQAVVSGSNAQGGTTADLLSKSSNALGVEVQKRSPLVGDPRIEGFHFGQVVTHADGAFWFPARVDLDTVISKLNADSIQNILIIKGPFSVRYGPGFSFLDVESLPTPRYKEGCFEAHGSTSAGYRTNGNGWQGAQNIWGGNATWGFRLSYDLQAAVDYTSGDGNRLPSGYNSHFVNFAYGTDLSPNSNLEIRYLHVQQSNVVLPGLLTDINTLATNGFTSRYTATEGSFYDRLTVDAWVNSTRFEGDSLNPGIRQQVPQLDNIFPGSFPGFAPVRLDIITNGNSLSYGAREIMTWGDPKGFNVSLGADIRIFSSNYNEFDAFNLSVLRGTGQAANLGIPYARQIDPGLLLDSSIPMGENATLKVGSRVDFVTTQFLDFGPNTDRDTYRQLVGNPDGDRTFFLFSGFATGEYKLTPEWTAQAGYGYAERPPTLTELYAGGAFLGLIQNGLNSIYGDPNLRKEAAHQLSLGLNAKYENVRAGANAFYTFLPNYITYRNFGAFTVDIAGLGTGTTQINRLQFTNTRRASMYGFDAFGEADVTSWLTPFATLSFVEGWDQTRDEALPGIAPLSSRVGLRFHEAGKNPRWGIEYFARMVATQDLFAASLGEDRTGGFVVHNLRTYWQARENLLLLAGVENIGNLNYREHLDLRTGSGVFQPGVNFYFSMKVNY